MKMFLYNNWFKLFLVIILSASLVILVVFLSKGERNTYDSDIDLVEIDETEIVVKSGKSSTPSNEPYIDWGTLDIASVIFSETAATLDGALPELRSVQEEERDLVSRMYGLLLDTSDAESRAQLETLIAYSERYIKAGEDLIYLLSELVKKYDGLIKSVAMRDSNLYIYYEGEVDELEAQKQWKLDAYTTSQSAKQNNAKEMLNGA
ncbi:MAG: hypothetical protein OEX08_00595 [Candidatus Nomurabacteria bacterium]|nr:hypothetical protein [Candidatus Nomurabacteria bacterium]